MRLPWVSRRRHEAAQKDALRIVTASLTGALRAAEELRLEGQYLRAENQRLREAVALHRPDPEPVEIETFCDDPDGCDQWIDDLGCNGHFREMLTCQECGETNVDGELGYLEWPCSTVRAASLDGEERE